jgi:hypothetical protein
MPFVLLSQYPFLENSCKIKFVELEHLSIATCAQKQVAGSFMRIWNTTIIPFKSVQSKKTSIFKWAHLQRPIPLTYIDSSFLLVCSVVSIVDGKTNFSPANHRGIEGNFPLIGLLSTQ